MSLFQPEDPAQHPFDTWRLFFSLIVQKRKMILVIVAATLLSTYLGLQFLSDQYEVEASLLVKLGPENVEIPVTAQSGYVSTTGVRKEEINSEAQLLKSRSLIEQVVDKLGVDSFKKKSQSPTGFFSSLNHNIKGALLWVKDAGSSILVSANLKRKLDDRQKAILEVERSLTVESVRESDVIAVTYKTPDPDLSVKFVQTLLELYMENHSRIRSDSTAKDFYQEQMRNHMKRLYEIEADRNAVKAAWDLYSISDQRSLLLKELMELRTQLDIHASERAMYQKQQAVMRERMDAIPDTINQSETVSPNPTVQHLKDQIANLQLEKAKLSSQFAPGSQSLSDIDAQISTLTQLLKQEAATQVAAHVEESNPLKRQFQQSIEQLDVQIAGLDAKIREIKLPVAKIENTLKRLNSGEDQLEKVNREQKLAEEVYESSAKRLEMARVSNELDKNRQVNVVILSPPIKPLEPVSPRRLLMLGLSLPAGMMLAVGLVLFMHYGQGTPTESGTATHTDVARAQSMPAVVSGDAGPDNGAKAPAKKEPESSV